MLPGRVFYPSDSRSGLLPADDPDPDDLHWFDLGWPANVVQLIELFLCETAYPAGSICEMVRTEGMQVKFAGKPRIFLGPWLKEPGQEKPSGVVIETTSFVGLESWAEVNDLVAGLRQWAEFAWGANSE